MNEIIFNIEKMFFIKKGDKIDLSFVPKTTKRKMSEIDKITVYAMNCCYDESVEKIVFSSRYGEFDRLIKLISQYTEENEVSPATFSASVHNYPVSFFSILKNTQIATSSIAGSEKSFLQGMLSALCSKEKNILYCYADEKNQTGYAVCLYISKNKKGKYIVKSNNKSDNTNDFIADIDEFINENKSFPDLSFLAIERANSD